MKTPKEIQLKVEQKRKEIVETSEKILKEAHEKHMCPNCNGQLPEGRRTWCSDECSYDFHMDHDYSQKSQILRDYRNELLAEYRELHPVKETQFNAFAWPCMYAFLVTSRFLSSNRAFIAASHCVSISFLVLIHLPSSSFLSLRQS